MGIIARQSIKYSLVGYLGFALGTLAVIFIFPNDLDFYGKLRYVLSTAEMFLPCVVLGVSFSNVKFFYDAQKVGKHQNFLWVSLLSMIFSFSLFTILFFVANWLFPSIKESAVWEMKSLILPLILILALNAIFNKYISNFKRIAIPNIFENLFPKIANIGAFSLFFYFGLKEKIAYSFFIGMFAFSLLCYVWYAHRLEKLQPDFSLNYLKINQLWKKVINYSLYGFLGNIGHYVALRVDNFMIGELIGFESNGVYSIILAILSFMMIPQMGINSISAPIINQHLEEKNYSELNQFYRDSSFQLFFQGLVIFSCILVGFPYLTELIKNGDKLLAASPILWVLGGAMLFDLATGFNGHIISLSKYYRINIVIMLLLAMLTISLNLIFIKVFNLGLLGVAMATAVSLTVFNLIKITFNWVKFGVFPLSRKMLSSLLLIGSAFSIAYLLPESHYFWINLIYKPLVLIILTIIGNQIFGIFPLVEYLNKFRNKKL
ncbi:lipopolysaccharide biosynthesis protein [Ornithobacterium rhinotracheale]|uniref:Membrane protein involved in the export of O-antigen and teichoic acid n=1 Tax=Ornithobacterium rhinotracheale (strain ATCC 51463 / DSM 15997 / CCUG 23171 / CIP 104009 / LMG 9086) TaxID=867902 RepID=I4A2W9_ORNRL|nr:polysaccharide biosynthesis protein [Ornithobacterium rhinotracheale]AFL98303.1 membrane protein involved in the export of O-antigen and teichoic acid [Ornithobacterium rhinotracheale DSM 15997]AIQ00076.1 polysaccharide biosynthesis protein [Ornithobacterium rhinotracheale ORT-UMN 88]KGB66170.1 polysaccharide biosynthesis protein [Ornithobacterium rhinotracheale H06-030791]MCK0193350.1 polysaccharide biosynthesis protein [Ornithobacterium rhinotracheale]MCK0201204.1 polysaccharide biosynthe